MARFCGKVAIAGEISGGDLPTARKSKVTCRTLPRSVTTPTNSWNSSDTELNTMGRSHKHPTLIHSQEMKTVAPKGESRKSEMTHCWYHIQYSKERRISFLFLFGKPETATVAGLDHFLALLLLLQWLFVSSAVGSGLKRGLGREGGAGVPYLCSGLGEGARLHSNRKGREGETTTV